MARLADVPGAVESALRRGCASKGREHKRGSCAPLAKDSKPEVDFCFSGLRFVGMTALRSAAPSGSFTALPSLAGRLVEIVNNSGALLKVRRADDTTSGNHIELKDGQSKLFQVSANASELQVMGTGTDNFSYEVS